VAALPVLFLSHGSPMHAIQPGAVREVWQRIVRELPRPTDEQFLPLFFALGAAGDNYKAERLYDGIEMGALAMDAYRFS
jgi:aromatic ring-opening dioxygenase catalytic subunit (LigB family)